MSPAGTATTTGDDLAVALAVASLIVSALSLLWSAIVALRLDSARLRVDISPMYLIAGTKSTRVVSITTTNIGRRATRLNSLWLVYGRPERHYERFLPRSLRRTVGLLLPDAAWTAANTVLPTLLDVGDQAVVFYSADVVLARASEHGETKVHGSANGATARAHSRAISTSRIGADPHR